MRKLLSERSVKLISLLLAIVITVGLVPISYIRAELDRDGEYVVGNLLVSYKEQATWGTSVQAEVKLTNISSSNIDSWNLSFTYLEDIYVTNIWNSNLISDSSTSSKVIEVEDMGYNSCIRPQEQVSFGLIIQGVQNKPISPLEVKSLDSSLHEPTNEDITPQITQNLQDIQEPYLEDFSYVIFTGSSDKNLSISGYRSNIVGDLYSGKDFVYQGSELQVEGSIYSYGSSTINGYKTQVSDIIQNSDKVEIPNWSNLILAKQDELDILSKDIFESRDEIEAYGYFYTEDSIDIKGTTFNGDVVIVSKQDITYNVQEITGEGKVFLYSEEGNITINGSKININGIANDHQGWRVGDPIDKLTKAGNEPSWSAVKSRYWKNEAYYNPGDYRAQDLKYMVQGKAPHYSEAVDVPKELHHIEGRSITNPHAQSNLLPVWPWQHAAINSNRHYNGPVP